MGVGDGAQEAQEATVEVQEAMEVAPEAMEAGQAAAVHLMEVDQVDGQSLFLPDGQVRRKLLKTLIDISFNFLLLF